MEGPFTLRGKTVLVTGASSGIGRATAELCARLGARVFATGRDEGRLRETMRLLVGDGHLFAAADLATEDGVAQVVAAAPELDGLVLCAGCNVREPVPYLRAETTERIFGVNALSPIRIVNALARALKLRNGASVVFVSSIAARGACSVGNGPYAAAKAAVSAFARHAALELAAKGIRSNSVAPGVVETPFLAADRRVSDEQWAKERGEYPLGRFGKPGDVANAIAFLLSDASSWITGTELVVDGGRSLK